MGDRGQTLAKARKELEDLYSGVPDESVNLTFQDFVQVRHQHQHQHQHQHNPEINNSDKITSLPLAKFPSIDFKKSLEASTFHQRPTEINLHHRPDEDRLRGPGPHHHAYVHHHHDHGSSHHGHDHQRSMVYDHDMMSHVMSVDYGVGRRRPGIPHSNICTMCSNYIYICRHRCLVCGRVYCRQCVSMGMGEMTEGRKCIDCLGRRFSQRYIHKAGNVGCCMGYSSVVKQQELKWAEKGARRRDENRYASSMMMASRSRSPVGLATPTRPIHSPANPPSFVMNSPTNHHPMPF